MASKRSRIPSREKEAIRSDWREDCSIAEAEAEEAGVERSVR